MMVIELWSWKWLANGGLMMISDDFYGWLIDGWSWSMIGGVFTDGLPMLDID